MAGKRNGAEVLDTPTPHINSQHDEDTAKSKAPRFDSGFFSGEKRAENADANGKNHKSLADFEHYRITKEKPVPPTPPFASIGESPVAAPGNITPVTAEGKAGKTALRSTLIAGAISPDGTADIFEQISVKSNPDGKAVLDFDTEQSEADQQYNLVKSLERAGMRATPDYYHSYNIRTLPLSQYKDFTISICELCREKYNGIHLIVIDGGADYITSVNNEEEANEIVAFFVWLAVEYDCPVILVIHLNENAGKNNDTMPRGHVGRQAIRKGYAQLNITKEGDVSTLQVLRARKASSVETPLIHFRYDKEKGYHTSVDGETIIDKKQAEKAESTLRKTEMFAKKVFAPPTALRHKDAISQLMKATSKTESTAKRMLKDMLGWDLVKVHDDGFYRLVA